MHPLLALHAEKEYDGNKLTGTVIGTEKCYDYGSQSASYEVNTPAKAFDGDLSTYVATYDKSHTWVGLDLGTPHVITRVGWSPRDDKSGPKLVLLGIFEGSNREDFMDAIPLYMITEEGSIGLISYADVHVSRGFRYVRWCGPAASRCNVAEVEFYGYEGEGDDSRFYQLTNLPTLSYHTYSGLEPYDKVHELESEMCLIYDGGTRLQEYPVLARERGNGSRYELFMKRPYRIKFNDGKSHHMLKDSPLQSPAKCRKWTLIPNWRDKSLMRNNIAFEMSRRLGLSYTPWIQNVDVIVNGEFKGNYQLCDQVTVDANRVDIAELGPDDNDEPYISGGYLLEITHSGEQYHFSSSHGLPVDVKYPDADEITSQQFTYIRNAFNNMESKLWASNYTNVDKGYYNWLDLGSFLRWFLVGEFAGNTDALWSIYVYKERGDDLFHFGPVWDFDLCMDNDRRVYPANGKPNWLFNYGSAVPGSQEFVNRVLSDPYATETLSSIWSGMRKSRAFTHESLCAFIDSLAHVIDQSQKLNFTRWDNLGELLTLQQSAPGTYQGELDIIKNYLKARIEWIDSKLGYVNIQDVDPSDTLFIINYPADFMTFQHAVNQQGLTHLNGRVNADLDLSSICSRLEPIGNREHPYAGTFSGDNHIISGLIMERQGDNVGLFGSVTAGAVIAGITLDSSCKISGANGVGLIGAVQGEGAVTLQALGNEGSVVASGRCAAGILGQCLSTDATVQMSYCYASGSVSGQQESAALCGWLGQKAQVTRCYSTASVGGVSNNASFARYESGSITRCFSNHKTVQYGITQLTAASTADGSLCYRLNDHTSPDAKPYFFQTLGTDDHPVLQHHMVVLRDGNTYRNKTDFDIATPQDLIDFAVRVNTGMPNLDATVIADLDFKGYTITSIGTADFPYVGRFDGQGHTFSNLTVKSSGDYVGLFGRVGGGATIRNFVLDETCSISGGAFVGIIGGSNGTGTVIMECLGNEGSVTAVNQNAGGIFGCNMNAAATPIFCNCYVTGPVIGGRESGQITGYAGNGQAYNCYASGTIEGYYYKDMNDAMLRGNPKSSHCYSTVPDKNATVVTQEQVSSGELCYLLNQTSGESYTVWFQTLFSDGHPVLNSAHSEVELASDGTFYNEGSHLHFVPLSAQEYETYSVLGTRMSKSQRGIHIIRTRDGKTFKVAVK